MTNFQLLARSRKKQKPGDVFAMLMPDNKYLFGRVIAIDATLMQITDCILLYIYKARSVTKEIPRREVLRPEHLLLPPMVTNRQGWNHGVFETIEHLPLDERDVLQVHCLLQRNGKYVDEHQNLLPGPVEPVGKAVLKSFRTIDDAISRALGIDLAAD